MYDNHRSDHPTAPCRWQAALLRCYPRAWRERYGQELADLLRAEPASVRLAFDLLRGALDAHLHPQCANTAPPRARRALGLVLLAALLLGGGYIAQHPVTASTFDTLGTALHSPHFVATATLGEHSYSQRNGRPE